MKIIPDKQRLIWLVLSLVLFMCASGIFWYVKFNYAAMFIMAFGFILSIRYWFTYGKEIELDAKGITISFLFYRKKVTWKDVKCIRTFDAYNTISHNSSLSEGLEIFLREKNRPRWLRPDAYGFYMNSINYLFFSFSGTEQQPKGRRLPVDYKVDERELTSILHKWGIPVEEKRNRRKKGMI